MGDLFETSTDVGEGVGEFCPLPDDDEGEDPRQHNIDSDTRKSRPQLQHKGERSTLPSWLLTDYADVRERLASEIRGNPSHKPTCYDRGSFIDGSPFAFFNAKNKFQVHPELFYKPTYFVWDTPSIHSADSMSRLPITQTKDAERYTSLPYTKWMAQITSPGCRPGSAHLCYWTPLLLRKLPEIVSKLEPRTPFCTSALTCNAIHISSDLPQRS